MVGQLIWLASWLGTEVERLLILVGFWHLIEVKLKLLLLLLRLRLLDKFELAGRGRLGKVKLFCVRFRLEIETELLLSLWFNFEAKLILRWRGWSAEKTEEVLLYCWLLWCAATEKVKNIVCWWLWLRRHEIEC